jgi:hypothetical protein
VARRNNAVSAEDVKSLAARLERVLGKKVVMLPNAPPHHVGMFLAVLPGDVAIVGDPSLSRGAPGIDAALAHPDYTPETQRQFDDVAAAVASQGYRVVRIPTAVDADGKTYLTYVNGLMNHEAGRRVVYMPAYAGAEPLNAAAERTWHDCGFDVRRVDCTSIYREFGTLHCLVNVLKRS